ACFAEQARDRARHSDVVVTNHAMLAIDAMSGIPLLPDHDVVVIDEGHELVERATGAVTDELTAAMVERAARRARRYVRPETHEALLVAAEALGEALTDLPAGRVTELRGLLFDALVGVRDVGHQAVTEFTADKTEAAAGVDDAARKQARAAVEEVHEIAGRVVGATDADVVWVTHSDRFGAALRRAPLSVAGLLRERLFGAATAVLTSATLELGGSFETVAGALGLLGDDAPAWSGLDVGSPFDYPRQGILYVARHLPPPGRDGLAEQVLDELAGLVEAAGGRTLGLFSSMRAAQQATEALRERLPDHEILCQGDDATAELVREFAADPHTCLFGTLSLWQGVDVPGAACQLVVIDRIPFPRPDDPLVRARQEAAGAAGFMAVSAAAAALLLAQGAGRLIRSREDRGVVAVLDSRLATARYGGFLRRSLPPFWPTTDPEVVRRSLRSLATPPAPPADPA
ncbi:MAG: ATP-dependent DNA helicase, partial [Actinomycetia bacterium]|nr:ATP-dependent DNA helicase [Actinomycetes bacterium]